MIRDIIVIKKPGVSISPGIFAVVVLTMLFGSLPAYLSALFCIMLHEAGHIVAALLFRCEIRQVRLLPVGMNAVIDDAQEPEQRIAVYLAGPAVNALLIILCLFLGHINVLPREKAEFFILTNILLFAVNLIPVLPLDGGRILKELLSGRVGLIAAARHMHLFSVALAIILLILGILQLIQNTRNFTLLLLSLYILITRKKGNREAALMNMKQILHRRLRILKKGVYPVRDIAVLQSMKMGEVLKYLDFDRYHFLHILDEELRLVAALSEQEFIDAIVSNGTDMTLEELIRKSKQ